MAQRANGTGRTWFSLGARRALYAWQPPIPLLTSLPSRADEAN